MNGALVPYKNGFAEKKKSRRGCAADESHLDSDGNLAILKEKNANVK